MSQSLEELLLVETSRRNTDLVADMVLQRKELFESLFEVFLRNEEPVSRRAAWVVDTVTEKMPELLTVCTKSIIEKLPGFTHDGMKRQSLRMLSRAELSSEDLGPLMNICFDWLISPGESVAVKVYSMDILYRISQSEPDLKKELADSIEWRIEEETAGFQSKGKKILKKLYKEMNQILPGKKR
jgi:hypothetical protein